MGKKKKTILRLGPLRVTGIILQQFLVVKIGQVLLGTWWYTPGWDRWVSVELDAGLVYIKSSRTSRAT